MPSEDVNQMTRSEWRELGFFYESDDQAKEWRLVGSRAGLLCFHDLLLEYVADPRNDMKSEHEHYGSYAYLEIMTWPDPGMDGHAIYGSVEDLRRLAAIIYERLLEAEPGVTIRIQYEYAKTSDYALILSVREDNFDPASSDSELIGTNG